jgi:MHS family shikimate/dehydroshikimate transporter-like MFS transporter
MAEAKNLNKIIFYSTLGNIVEYYDVMIYVFASTIVFNKLFFPQLDPTTALLASVGTLGLAVIGKPIGSILFGHFGDKYGRKATLIASLIMSAVFSVAIGLLPTYEMIGITATVALVAFKILQGMSICGEWTGASLMVYENVPKEKRTFYTSFIQLGLPLGTALASMSFMLLALLPKESFFDWGWRVPFLLSFILGIISGIARLVLVETKEFKLLQKNKQVSKLPLKDLFKKPSIILKAMGVRLSDIVVGQLILTASIAYLCNIKGVPRHDMVQAILYGNIINALTIPIYGYIADIIGNRKLLIYGGIISLLTAYPIFYLLDSGYYVTAILISYGIGHSVLAAGLSCYIPQMFNTNVRYTGTSLSTQMSVAIGASVTPVLGIYMAINYGIKSLALIAIGAISITLISVILTKETYK